ncbi:helix-turn-helix transcriptional regulator [Streptomyces sennicomposti]|uniref:helix-turn-helix transcriptional regulator n=1 Tax=Streptomyces sennicomposti TaxID=2873384 RepID=UPI001CA64045|nr:helix-turn-helix domain-containing protein [Streptomyces sennicomposti]MBY8867127.1 helix-turn-helix domain-containing protein [Streptomyces sennicomposti]
MASGREGPRRREVLDVLRAAGGPLGVAETAERIGVHPNTVRFHLDALVAEGLVERRSESFSGPGRPRQGPGRPRTVYVPTPGMDRGGARGYRLLARMLLSRLAAQGPEARASAMETGREWGGVLVDPPQPRRRPTAEEAAASLVALLDDLGFDPTPEGGGADRPPERIRLRHCPFLELAEEYDGLVCPLHLGLMQGALARLRAPLTATGLEPFATPDSCLARLAHADGDGDGPGGVPAHGPDSVPVNGPADPHGMRPADPHATGPADHANGSAGPGRKAVHR